MASESDAIPYEPALLRAERLLVIAPHPDDEVIGCGGLVALHLLEQRQVRIVVVTDGAEAGDAGARQAESRSGVEVLGDAPIEFLGFPDRGLMEMREACGARLEPVLREWKPDLVLVPSPVEFHPDHLALSLAFCELVQRDPTLHADLGATLVAFYEIGQPLRPNAIVDITSVAESKYAAVAAHASQLAVRDYVAYARGLNAFRAMTMPPESKYAEAYWTLPLAELRTTPISVLQTSIGAARGVSVVVEEPLPLSVVVRTKNRPALLAEAIDSIRSTGYPCEIVVVNDGGEPVTADGCRLVTHETSRGRSEAANAGVRAATNEFIGFLDDDDLFYPEHLAVLARAARGSQHRAWYTDAVSAFAFTGPNGSLETRSRLRLFGSDYDRSELLVDNYIPLPTLLFRRADFLDLGGFDPEFDLFEDWDFLIRLSARGSFVHVPRVTCEIRHIETAGSITMEAREGTAAFREAKLRIWKKHGVSLDPNLFADVLERRKVRIVELQSGLVDQRGRGALLETEIARLQREALYAGNELREAGHIAAGAEAATAELRKESERLTSQLAREISERDIRLAQLGSENSELRQLFTESQSTVPALYAEIRRLQGLLDMIYASRTWQLHTLVQKMKGRG